jgi:cell division protein ZapE
MPGTTLISSAYRARVDAGKILWDDAQFTACTALDRFCETLSSHRGAGGLLRQLFSRKSAGKGVYLYGGVGRGKSLVMDLFFAMAPTSRKLRVHFHQFMKDTEAAISRLSGQANTLDVYAADLASRYDLICFDEMHINDIVEATFIGRVFASLLKTSMCFCMTSNFAPAHLYQGGINRDLLLPTIELLQSHLEILCVDSGNDYRQTHFGPDSYYLCPASAQTHARMLDIFSRLDGSDALSDPLVIQQRAIRTVRHGESAVWFDFRDICGGPRATQDYLAIARLYPIVFVENVPVMAASQQECARRFTWLVDVLYDHRNVLVMSAQVAPDALYTGGLHADEFTRTSSRLTEMQSPAYVQACLAHQQAADRRIA